MAEQKPGLYTCLSPSMLHLYDVSKSIVVIIDVLRATSTIATALHNKARQVIPVATVAECINLGKQTSGITAGERDGAIAEGLSYGNSPFEYSEEFIGGKTLILTTTNGTKLLHMALDKGADEIITGSFPNLSAVCEYLVKKNKPVLLGCAAWKDKVNIEDTLFAGAVINCIGEHFELLDDASHLALNLYKQAAPDVFEYMKANDATHYHRLMNYGLEKDIRYCLTPDGANVLPVYKDGRLEISAGF